MFFAQKIATASVRDELEQLLGERRSHPTSREFHDKAIDRLNRRFDAHISILPYENRAHIDTFNCHAYALGLYAIPAYRALYERSGRYSAIVKGAFVAWLIKEGLVKECDEKPDAIVVYGSTRDVKHTGIVEQTGEFVRSKWARWEVYRHSPLEVPATYGFPCMFLERPNPSVIFASLKKWRASNSRSAATAPPS